MIAGIDLGSTATKVVCLQGGRLAGQQTLVGAQRDMQQALAAAKLFVAEPVERIAVTGAGAAGIGDNLNGQPVIRISEFDAIGAGGLWLSGLPAALVASVGTGTAFVRAAASGSRHAGGSGVGGGTALGLARQMCGVDDVAALVALAAAGRLAAVDITVGEVMRDGQPGLDADLTVANLGKAGRSSAPADLACGIFNMVFQTIGLLAAFAARAEGLADVVMTGRLVTAPQAGLVFARLGVLHQVEFHIPEYGTYATATGAAVLAEREGR